MKKNSKRKLQLTKHITPHTNGELLKHPHIQILLQFCYDSASLSSGLPMATISSALTSKASSKVVYKFRRNPVPDSLPLSIVSRPGLLLVN